MKVLKHNVARIIGITLLCLGVILVIANCVDGDSSINDDSEAVYTCGNGTPVDGKPSGDDNVEQCASCDSGYYRDSSNETCKAGDAYLCDNGTAADGMAPNDSSNKCKACADGYSLNQDTELCQSDNAYVCPNGTAVAGEADSSGVTNCESCNNFFKLNTTNMRCEATSYTCNNGETVEGKPNETADGGVADKNADIEKCKECDFSHALADGVCTLSTVGQWKFDVDATCTATVACVVTLASDGSVVWQGDCATHAPLNTYTNYEFDETSIIFKGGGSQHDFTVDTGDASFTLNPQSTTLSGNRYLCPFVGASVTQPTVDGAIIPNGTTFNTTVSHDGTLYWAVYADNAVVADGATLIDGVTAGTAGVARGDAAGMVVTTGSVMFSVSGLDAHTNYDLYVALETTVDGFSQQVLSAKYDVTTVGFAYMCENGTASKDEAPAADTTQCIACKSGYTLVDGANGKVCAEGFAYMCENGTEDTSAASPTEGVTRCTDCDPGYTLGSYSRGCGRQIDLQSYNDVPEGIWSDGTTMWVVDSQDLKIYAYALATGDRDTTKEFDLVADNARPSTMWGDSTTMWVLDIDDDKLYAYTLATGNRDTTKEFDLATDNDVPRGIWSDGTTMWVSDINNHKLYAYALPDDETTTTNDGMPDTAKDITLDADSTDSRNIASNGTTIWVSDNDDRKLYAYTLAHCIDGDSSTPCRDATNDLDVESAIEPRSGIWTDGTTMWVADVGDDIVYAHTIAQCTDSDANTPCRDTDQDVVLDTTNGAPYGTWTDGTTIWVADAADGRLYAYSLATGNRDAAQEIDLDADNYAPLGIWSDGTTMWVAQNNGTVVGDKIFAYTLATGARVEAKEFNLDSASRLPNGIWSDGTTMWVVDQLTTHTFAYVLPDDDPNTTNDGMRDTSNEFEYPTTFDAGGVWSDGTTMWIINNRANNGIRTVFAFVLPNSNSSTTTVGTRDTAKDFTTEAGALYSLTSDGTTFWVSERVDDMLLVY